MSATIQKKRNPGIAAFLSFLSMGTGQIYNGDLLKGVFIKGMMTLAFCLYALRIYREGSLDLFFFILLVVLFLILKVFSIIQGFNQARKHGESYSLNKFNKIYVYVGISLIFMVLSFWVPQRIKDRAVRNFASQSHPFRSAQAKSRFLDIYAQKAERWPIVSEEIVVETSYGRTFLRISGSQEAPPLVLLHGIGGSSLQWGPNIEELSRGFRTYAIDNIYDNGRSVYTYIFKTPDDFVSWLDELFNKLGLGDDINLVGLSYGGWLTSQYALSRPERLNKVVLIAPVATVMPLQWDWIWRASLCMIPHRHFFTSFMDWMLEDMSQGDSNRRAILKENAESGFVALSSFKSKPLVNPTVLADDDWRNLKIPALFLVGENEKLYPANAAVDRINRVAPQIITDILPDCGHDLTLIQADSVNQKLIDFLRSPVAKVPFDLKSQYIIFPASVDSLGPVNYLFDTGCQTTVINEETLGNRDRNQPLGMDIGAMKLKIDTYHVRPSSFHPNAMGQKIDGVIGNDILHKYTVELDFDRKIMLLFDEQDLITNSKGIEVPIEVNSLVSSVGLHLFFPDGKEIEGQFVVDTGAPTTVVLNSPIAIEHGIKADPSKNREFRTQAEVQTAVEVQTESIRIGTIMMPDVPIYISTSDKGLFAVKRYAGIVGTGLLKNFKVTFDYSHKRLILEE